MQIDIINVKEHYKSKADGDNFWCGLGGYILDTMPQSFYDHDFKDKLSALTIDELKEYAFGINQDEKVLRSVKQMLIDVFADSSLGETVDEK